MNSNKQNMMEEIKNQELLARQLAEEEKDRDRMRPERAAQRQ